MNTYHIPILVKEIVEGLRITPGGKYIDATVGGGGHTLAVVEHGGCVLGIDADQEAVGFARNRLLKITEKKEGTDWKVVQGNFRDIEQIAQREEFDDIDGVLFDLGVSSRQLDDVTK